MVFRAAFLLAVLVSSSTWAGPLVGIKPGGADVAPEFQWKRSRLGAAADCGFTKSKADKPMSVTDVDCSPGYSAKELKTLKFAMPKAVKVVKAGAYTVNVIVDDHGVATVHASGPSGIQADLLTFPDSGAVKKVLGLYAGTDPTKIVVEIRYASAGNETDDIAVGFDLADALKALADGKTADKGSLTPAGSASTVGAAKAPVPLPPSEPALASNGPLRGISDPGVGAYVSRERGSNLVCNFKDPSDATAASLEARGCVSYSDSGFQDFSTRRPFSMPQNMKSVNAGGFVVTAVLDDRGSVSLHARSPSGPEGDLVRFPEKGTIDKVLGLYAGTDPTRVVIEVRVVVGGKPEDISVGYEIGAALKALESRLPAADPASSNTDEERAAIAKADELAASMGTDLSEQCGAKITVTMDWPSFKGHVTNGEVMGNPDRGQAVMECDAIVTDVKNMCYAAPSRPESKTAAEKARKAISKKLRAVSCVYDGSANGSYKVALKDGVLTVRYKHDGGGPNPEHPEAVAYLKRVLK